MQCSVAEDGVQVLTFDLATEPMAEAPKADVKPVERVHFLYKTGCKFGETAPTSIVLDRADFPRNVGHLCAVAPGGPAAPCLAVGGIQPIYERAGIEAIMKRLRDFMRDTKTGTLMADGWEPVPFGVDEVFRVGQVDPAFFQNYALVNLVSGMAVGVAASHEEEGAQRVLVFPGALEPSKASAALAAINGENDNKRVGIPWIFVWPTQVQAENEPIFANWSTLGEVHAGLEQLGVATAFKAAAGELLTKDVDFKCHRPPVGGKGMVLVIGVWRPTAIMDAFFGYSDDPDARRLELRAFLISQDWDKDIVCDDARVETIIGHYPPHAKLLRWVSGLHQLPPIAMFGLGALGSTIFNNLARSGLDDAVVIDSDTIYPHNLARHTAFVSDAYKDKPLHADALIKDLLRDGSVRIETFKEDIVALELAVLKQRTGERLIIDATADERVRLKLDHLRSETNNYLVRTEMFHEGRLGVTFVSPPDGPTMSDTILEMIALAETERSIADWLDHEALHPLGPDPMLYGFGCTSQTVRLPNHVVQLQAAIATNVLLGDLSKSGVAINALDERFQPSEWKWHPVGPFVTLTPATEADWSIRVSQQVVEALNLERQAALPNETGGYLYGCWDPVQRTITIVRMTPLPPNSVASATELKLGAAGKSAVERRLGRKTHGRIYLCGTWHSHPNGSARMSGKDQKAMTAHQKQDEPNLSPTLVLIVADGDIQAHLRVPA